jgi:hypothetical protein
VVGSALGGLGRGGRGGGGGECGVVLCSGVSGRLVWRGKGGSRFPPYRGFLGSRWRRLRRRLREDGAEDVGLECGGGGHGRGETLLPFFNELDEFDGLFFRWEGLVSGKRREDVDEYVFRKGEPALSDAMRPFRLAPWSILT